MEDINLFKGEFGKGFMGDLASDHDSAISLTIDEWRRLKSHDENHELLKYLSEVGDDFIKYNEKTYKEYLDKFEDEADKKLDYVKVAKVLSSYYVALRDAVDKIEGIDRSPKWGPPENYPYGMHPDHGRKTIETKVDEPGDLPF